MVSFEEAKALIDGHVRILSEETIALDQALGRILTEDIYADRDYPPFNRSAMDGYAIKLEDWESGIREYRIAELILAGQPSSIELEKGCCYKIMTGAAVPAPADVVIRVEDAEANGKLVSLSAGTIRAYMNISRQGEDLKQGSPVLTAPVKLSPQLVSILAVVGCAKVKVRKLPVAAVLTTGDEVVEPGQPVLPYQIRNSNSHLIRSMLQINGLTPGYIDHVRDNKAAIRTALEKAMEADLLIVNGGVSAGDADYVPELLESLQVKKLFHKAAIRPGKPIWIGQQPNGGLVFALPGNPFSCLVTFNLFVKRYLFQIQGMPAPEFLQLPFSGTRHCKVHFDEFFPVKLNPSGTRLEAVPINGSGDVRLGLNAQAIAWHPAGKAVINDQSLVKFFVL